MKKERLAMWQRCLDVFASHSYPPVLAALFLLDVAAKMETELRASEQALLFASALSLFLSSVKTQSALGRKGSADTQRFHKSGRGSVQGPSETLKFLLQCSQGVCPFVLQTPPDADSRKSDGLLPRDSPRTSGDATPAIQTQEGSASSCLLNCLPLPADRVDALFLAYPRREEVSCEAAETDFVCKCISIREAATAHDKGLVSLEERSEGGDVEDPASSEANSVDCNGTCLVTRPLFEQLASRLLLLLAAQSTKAAATASASNSILGETLFLSSLEEGFGNESPLETSGPAKRVALLLHQRATALPLSSSGKSLNQLIERLEELFEPDSPALPFFHLEDSSWPSAAFEGEMTGTRLVASENGAEAASSGFVEKTSAESSAPLSAEEFLLQQLRRGVYNSIAVGDTLTARCLVAATSGFLSTPSFAQDGTLTAAGGNPSSLRSACTRSTAALGQDVQLAEMLLRTATVLDASSLSQQRLVLEALSAATTSAEKAAKEGEGKASKPSASSSLPQFFRDLLEVEAFSQAADSPPSGDKGDEAEIASQSEGLKKQQLKLLTRLVRRCSPRMQGFFVGVLTVFAVSRVLNCSFESVVRHHVEDPQELLLRLLLKAAFPTSEDFQTPLCTRLAEKLCEESRLAVEKVAAVVVAAFVSHQKTHFQKEFSGQGGVQTVRWFQWPAQLLRKFLKICKEARLVGILASQRLREGAARKRHDEDPTAETSYYGKQEVLPLEVEVEVALLAYTALEASTSSEELTELLAFLRSRLPVYMQLGKPYLLLRLLTAIPPCEEISCAVEFVSRVDQLLPLRVAVR